MKRYNERRIGIVAEGVSDFTILNTLICDRLAKRKDCKQLQPSSDFRSQNGWFGVWKFCSKQIGRVGFENYCDIGEPIDALIVCVDGDQSSEGTHFCHINGKPDTKLLDCCEKYDDAYACALARSADGRYRKCTYFESEPSCVIENCDIDARVAFLERCVRSWTGVANGHEKLIIVVPCDMIEAWIIAGYEGAKIGDTPVEHIANPFREHIRKQPEGYYGFMLPAKDLEAKNKLAQQFASLVTERWPSIVQSCSQAKRFSQALERLM